MNLRAHALDRAESSRNPSPWLEILGFLTLPSVIAVVIALLHFGIGGGAVAIGFAAWILMLIVLYSWVRSDEAIWPAVLGTLFLTLGGAFVELWPAAILVLSGTAGVVAYFLVAGLVAISLSAFAYNRLLSRR
jgi:hypothetical protein